MSALADRSELVKSAWTMKQALHTDISDVVEDLRELNSQVDKLLVSIGDEADSPVLLRGEWSSLVNEISSVTKAAAAIDEERHNLIVSRIDDKTYKELITLANITSRSIAKYNGKWKDVMDATKKVIRQKADTEPRLEDRNRIIQQFHGAIRKIEDIAEEISSGLLDIEAGLKELRFTKASDGKEIGIYSANLSEKVDNPASSVENQRLQHEPQQLEDAETGMPSEQSVQPAQLDPFKVKADYLTLQKNLKDTLDAADVVHGDDPLLSAIIDKFSVMPVMKTFFRFNDWIAAKEKEGISNEDLLENYEIMLEEMQKFYPAAKAAVDELKKEVKALKG